MNKETQTTLPLATEDSTMEDSTTKNYNLLIERIKARYGDEALDELGLLKKFDEDEMLFTNLKTEGGKLSELFDKDPRNAQLLSVMRDGGNIISFMMENYGDDFVSALEDPEQKEKIAEAHANWLSRMADDKKIKEKCEANLTVTMDNLKSVQASHNLSDEQTDELLVNVSTIAQGAIESRIDIPTLEMIIKALNYDKDLAETADVSEKRGKNTKIEEKIRKDNEDTPTSLRSSGSPLHTKQEAYYNPFKV